MAQNDLFLLPFWVAFLSVSVLFFKELKRRIVPPRQVKEDAKEEIYRDSNITLSDFFGSRVGGFTIFSFILARLLCCILLLCLSMYGLKGCLVSTNWISMFSCLSKFEAITYLYTCILATTPLISGRNCRLHTTHCNLVLLSAFSLYAYRDLWPLATYTDTPADIEEGNILWIKITILALTAVLIPLFTPEVYIPVDLKNPMPTPNPDQTASWISKLTFSYLDSVVILGSKVSHLHWDQLPPLADNYFAQYETRKAFHHIDPFAGARWRHLFWGLLYHFRTDYFQLAIGILGVSLSSFAAPIGIKKILEYLQTRGINSTTRPWFWISWLFLGPMINSIATHWYYYISTRMSVRIRTILTQLAFEHGLRLRQKADSDISSDGKTAKKGSGSLIGRLNNLVTSDMENILDGRDFLGPMLQVPLQIVFSIAFLYTVLGWSAIVALVTPSLFSPLAGYLGRKFQAIQKIKMTKTDARVQTTTEAIGVLRMIKLFGWEHNVFCRLDENREEELKWLWTAKMLKLSTQISSQMIPTVTMIMTYMTYTVIMREELDASKIFSSMLVFSILRSSIFRLSWQTAEIIEGKVSLDRFSDFLRHTELLDSFSESPSLSPSESALPENGENQHIGFRNATFTWSAEDEGAQAFRLHVDGEILFKCDRVNLIVGPTGSGKTSMLMALLGEMHFIPSGHDSWFNLPREGGVAYAAQESWVMNATIRENILFGSAYDAMRYEKVIRQCALDPDLAILSSGDATEVGERGLTLSGGQKARVTLARAVYSQAKIILLDDVFAALDVHTSSWIAQKCLRGDLMKGRTTIIVTHNVALVASIAQVVVSIGPDGRVQKQDTDVEHILTEDPVLVEEPHRSMNETQKSGAESIQIPGKDPKGKLMVAEEIVEGRVTWRSMMLLLSSLGGNHPILFISLWVSGIIISHVLTNLQPWFLGLWGSQYETHQPSEVDLSFYLCILSLIVFAQLADSTLTDTFYIGRTIKASRAIHAKLIHSIFAGTLRWLDETPTARIIVRCTQDIRAVDGPVVTSLMDVVEEITAVLAKVSAIVIFSPIFILPAVAVTMSGIYIGKLYLKAQLSIKREMSNSRSPVLGHFNTAMHGLVSIRAYGAQTIFIQESRKRIDHYSRIARVSWNLNRWVGLRTDALGAVFTAALASYLVYGNTVGAANTGFSLNMAVGFCTYIFYLIRTFNDLEIQSNSLERIQGYIDIEHESPSIESGKPPAAWPTSGNLRVENLSARYSQSGPEILHNLSFHITSGQRVGIVGRTGSGKSSLTLALLRCILTEGTVYYDGIDTNTINLDALRSNITIIPQTPELLSGTLRQNLDPFEQHDDATLNDALRASGLYSLQEEGEEARFTLDTKIEGGGNNLSVGQRQIIALARAIVRGSKLLILDEATSAIDYKTDTTIQNTLRSQLGFGVTVITIAHRIQTVLDADKIMVLDNGHIVEFDTPKKLLEQDGGIFLSLVEGTRTRNGE